MLWALLNLTVAIAFLALFFWVLVRISHGGDGLLPRRRRDRQHRARYDLADEGR